MKTTMKIIEVIIWIPFILVGFVSRLMFQGIAGGWASLDKLHEWMDS